MCIPELLRQAITWLRDCTIQQLMRMYSIASNGTQCNNDFHDTLAINASATVLENQPQRSHQRNKSSFRPNEKLILCHDFLTTYFRQAAARC